MNVDPRDIYNKEKHNTVIVIHYLYSTSIQTHNAGIKHTHDTNTNFNIVWRLMCIWRKKRKSSFFCHRIAENRHLFTAYNHMRMGHH